MYENIIYYSIVQYHMIASICDMLIICNMIQYEITHGIIKYNSTTWYDMISNMIPQSTSIKAVFVTCFFLSNVRLQYECLNAYIQYILVYIYIHNCFAKARCGLIGRLSPIKSLVWVCGAAPMWNVMIGRDSRMSPELVYSLMYFFVNNFSSDNRSKDRIQTESTTYLNQTLASWQVLRDLSRNSHCLPTWSFGLMRSWARSIHLEVPCICFPTFRCGK